MVGSFLYASVGKGVGADILQDDLVGVSTHVDAVGGVAVVLLEAVLVVLENGLGVQVAAAVLGGDGLDPLVGVVDLGVVQIHTARGDGEDGLENDLGLGGGLLNGLDDVTFLKL